VPEHFPGTGAFAGAWEFDDADILRLTGKHLDALGFHVSLKAPDESPVTVAVPPSAMFICEQTGIDI
jgi:hypothetical protein